jgi:hypothetical protein
MFFVNAAELNVLAEQQSKLAVNFHSGVESLSVCGGFIRLIGSPNKTVPK